MAHWDSVSIGNTELAQLILEQMSTRSDKWEKKKNLCAKWKQNIKQIFNIWGRTWFLGIGLLPLDFPCLETQKKKTTTKKGCKCCNLIGLYYKIYVSHIIEKCHTVREKSCQDCV